MPPLVGERTTYNLRNVNDINLPPGKKSGLFNSFFPSSIRIWNKLDRGMKNSQSLDSFKFHLKKSKCLKKTKLYSKFNGSMAINHTRMRLGLSGLKAQRHDYNHVPNSTCDYCGSRKDDSIHFLLKCRAFAPMRRNFLQKINRLYTAKNIYRDLSRTIVQKELVDKLLMGDPRLSEPENIELFNMVQDFICNSKIF
jgi:hypothetical protein